MTNPLPSTIAARPPVRARRRLGLRVGAAALLVASVGACSSSPAPSGTPAGTGSPTTTPTSVPSPTIAGLQHPTGARDIVLRFEESGGFVPVEFLATSAPSFTLYGDGTAVFRDPTAMPPASNDSIMRSTPFMTVRLDEEAIQALLNEALGPGALAIAKGPYMGNMADVPSSTFTIAIGGETKQVSVMGLSPESHEQDKAIITAIAAFAQKLNAFGSTVTGARPYEPSAFRGVINLIDQPFGKVIDWPWTDLTPADFTSGENQFLQTHVLTPAQVQAVGIADVSGGMSGLSLQSKGRVYTLSLRPLLPDETQ